MFPFHLAYIWIDAIIEARSERISALLEMCYKLVDQYEATTRGDTTMCTSGQPSEECDSLVYGCLIRGLQRLELLPERAKASQIESSVTDCADKLRSLKCFAYPDRHYNRDYYNNCSSTQSHSTCIFTLAFADQIRAIIDGKEPSGVHEAHLTHICEQKK